MKIRVKVVCTFLTLSKKPPLFQILATRLVLGQVQQLQQQTNSVRCNNNTATSSLCVPCSRRGIVDYDVMYNSTNYAKPYYKSGVVTAEGNVQ